MDGTHVDYIKDAGLLKAKLINYKLNLAAGLYNPFQKSEGSVNVTQHVNQDVHTNVIVTFEQTIHNILKLPETELSTKEKEELIGKLTVILLKKIRRNAGRKLAIH